MGYIQRPQREALEQLCGNRHFSLPRSLIARRKDHFLSVEGVGEVFILGVNEGEQGIGGKHSLTRFLILGNSRPTSYLDWLDVSLLEPCQHAVLLEDCPPKKHFASQQRLTLLEFVTKWGSGPVKIRFVPTRERVEYPVLI